MKVQRVQRLPSVISLHICGCWYQTLSSCHVAIGRHADLSHKKLALSFGWEEGFWRGNSQYGHAADHRPLARNHQTFDRKKKAVIMRLRNQPTLVGPTYRCFRNHMVASRERHTRRTRVYIISDSLRHNLSLIHLTHFRCGEVKTWYAKSSAIVYHQSLQCPPHASPEN
jgi:hypothetical protein